MIIAIIGAGYVGLTTAACLAELGHSLVGIDLDEHRVDALSSGVLPIYEPGLEALVRRNVGAGRLRFSTDVEGGVAMADAVFLAVGTPSTATGESDLSYIEAAARQIARAIKPNAVVVIKSTVVAGTARALRELIAEERGGLDFSVASNPEFLREGSAIDDFLHPDRIVIGSDDPRSAGLLRELYAPLVDRGASIIVTTTTNAELIKYAANSFLALKIGFINDVANLCEKVGGDVGAVSHGVGLDRRIGAAFLVPGPGFGGSCFPKDTRAFAATGRKFGAPQSLIEMLVVKNEERKRSMARRIIEALSNGGSGASVAILGVAFKASTDDARESAALAMVPILQDAGINVRAHDPQVRGDAVPELRDVSWHESAYAAAEGADAVVILTEWDDYRALDLERIAAAMAGDTLIDFRNLLDPAEVARHDLRYLSLGRAAGDRSEPRKIVRAAANSGMRASQRSRREDAKQASPARNSRVRSR
jgi:UDPglucose 6-dehydrogenase